MAAKKYTPKDINKNGKLDQWEINKYKLINKGKPQMGMGEQGALKPKFLKGILTKDDGSMTTLGNIGNILSGGMIGQGKSFIDMFRGGNPAMYGANPPKMKKPMKYVSDAQRKAVHASKKDGGKGNPNNKPKAAVRVTAEGSKAKTSRLTGVVKGKKVRTEQHHSGSKSTLTKRKLTKEGNEKFRKKKSITNKRAARIAKRYNK